MSAKAHIRSKDPRRPQPTTLHTRNVPPHLKTQFKAWCVKRGYTMEAVIVACMRRVLEEDKSIPAARRPTRIGG